MRAIWKYPLPVARDFTLEIPDELPRVLDLHEQRGGVALWVEVSPDVPRAPVRFRWVMTGEHFNVGAWNYLGAHHAPNGIVAHLYGRIARAR